MGYITEIIASGSELVSRSRANISPLKQDPTKDSRIYVGVTQHIINNILGQCSSADLTSKHEYQVIVAEAFCFSNGKAKLVDGSHLKQFLTVISNIGATEKVSHPALKNEVPNKQFFYQCGIGVMKQFLHRVGVVFAFVVFSNYCIALVRPFRNIKLKDTFHAGLRGLVTWGGLTIPRLKLSAL